MGKCLSKDSEDSKTNAEINEIIRKDKKKSEAEVKMLLLGAGESGKSTILKQMKMIHSSGYTREEKESFKEIVYSNTVQSMKVILDAMEIMGIRLKNEGNYTYKNVIDEADNQIEEDVFPGELVIAIKTLWSDRGVQETFYRSNEYQLNDSAEYFFNAIDRISTLDYIPSDQDVLRSRVKSTGIVELSFSIGHLTYKMFDVGGQRSERKKWIHCFENVTAIVFMVAISEYDQVLIEDESINRMQESLILFDSICNSRWFVKTAIILFLNKIDIFKIKIKNVPIEKYFPSYKGGPNYEEGTDFFIKSFLALNQSETKKIYPHLTCGTDTGQIKFVMSAVNSIIIDNMLDSVNLL